MTPTPKQHTELHKITKATIVALVKFTKLSVQFEYITIRWISIRESNYIIHWIANIILFLKPTGTVSQL